MKVEWIGGPKDGSMMEIPEGWKYVELHVGPPIGWPDKPADHVPSVQTIRFDIEKRKNGKRFVRWRTF